jgi:acetyltransferase-like isoleucine patch superfamily enzyme
VTHRRPNKWLSLIAWLLPSCSFKLWALRSLGNHIGHDVVLGYNLVWNCGHFSIGDGMAIGHFNTFKGLSSIELGPRSTIGVFNYFTADVNYQQYSSLVGKLILGDVACIVNRHYVDCSGQVILQPFSAIGGIRTVILSHELDYYDNKAKVGRVVLGRNAVATTGCILLKDSYLPERSVLAAGSVLSRVKEGDNRPVSSIYGGVPARFVREMEGEWEWWDRLHNYGGRVVEDEKFRVE